MRHEADRGPNGGRGAARARLGEMYFRYYQSPRRSALRVSLTAVSCAVAAAVTLMGPVEAQRFALSQSRDLLIDPATYDPALGISRLASHPPLEQILIYMDAVRLQTGVALGLFVRLCGLLARTRPGMVLAELGLIFSAGLLLRYASWSFSLLNCESCSRNVFFLSAPPTLGYLLLSCVLLMTAVELFLLAKFFARTREPDNAGARPWDLK